MTFLLLVAGPCQIVCVYMTLIFCFAINLGPQTKVRRTVLTLPPLVGDLTGRSRRAPSAARPNYALLEDDEGISSGNESQREDEDGHANAPRGRAAAPSPNAREGHSAAAAPKRPQRATSAAAARAISAEVAAENSDSDFDPDTLPVRSYSWLPQ